MIFFMQNVFLHQHQGQLFNKRANYVKELFSILNPNALITYDPDKDVFIEPPPYSSWTLDESKWQWKAPKDKPDDGKDYTWNENKLEWEEIVYE